MQGFIAFFEAQNFEWSLVFFLMFFSCFVAVFHTLILSSMWDFKFKGVLFFILNPSLIFFAGLAHKGAALFVFLLLFSSVFFLAISGVMVASICSYKERKKEQQKFNKKYNIAPDSWGKKLWSVVAVVLFFGAFLTFGPIAIALIFIVIPIFSAFMPSNRNRFFNIENTLPTSKIRSIAMGLAEIEGRLIMIDPLTAPIKSSQSKEAKPCIGFVYKIESISRDDDGHTRYSTVFHEKKCNPFYVEDETGKIEVNPDGLELISLDVDEQYSRGGKRYSQYLLLENEKMLLVGKASYTKNNQPVFEYENIKQVFGIAPSNDIVRRRSMRPLLNSALTFFCFFAFFSALILITPIEIEGNTIVVGYPEFKQPFE